MNEPNILNTVRLPARLDVHQTAKVLGFSDHEIPLLVSSRLLKPLGSPAQNAPKFFAAAVIEQCARDAEWLDKATKAISRTWRIRNQRGRQSDPSTAR